MHIPRYDAAAALHDAGNLKLAKRYYERAASLNEYDAQPYNNLGALLLQSGAPPREALHCFRAAHRRDPDSAQAALNIGGLLLGLDRVHIICIYIHTHTHTYSRAKRCIVFAPRTAAIPIRHRQRSISAGCCSAWTACVYRWIHREYRYVNVYGWMDIWI